MAIPAAVVALLGKAATNAAVQAGAQRLVQDVYGRIAPNRAPSAPSANEPLTTPQEIVARVDALPTRAEIAASLALLQAELDRRHRIALAAIGVVLAAQGIVILLLLLR